MKDEEKSQRINPLIAIKEENEKKAKMKAAGFDDENEYKKHIQLLYKEEEKKKLIENQRRQKEKIQNPPIDKSLPPTDKSLPPTETNFLGFIFAVYPDVLNLIAIISLVCSVFVAFFFIANEQILMGLLFLVLAPLLTILSFGLITVILEIYKHLKSIDNKLNKD